MKLLGKKIGENLHGIGFGNDFLDMTPNAWAIKEKHIGLHQNLKLLCIKGPYQESKKAIYSVGENIHKSFVL